MNAGGVGSCSKCGQKTHEKKFLKLKPLTVPGQVENGVCLKCYKAVQDPPKDKPSTGAATSTMPSLGIVFPSSVDLHQSRNVDPFDDGQTVVSGLTLDSGFPHGTGSRGQASAEHSVLEGISYTGTMASIPQNGPAARTSPDRSGQTSGYGHRLPPTLLLDPPSNELTRQETKEEIVERPVISRRFSNGSTRRSLGDGSMTPSEIQSIEEKFDNLDLPDIKDALQLMKEYPHDTEIQKQMLEAVITLVSEGHGDSVFANSGIQIIVAGMCGNMESPMVQEAAIFALWVLAASNRNVTNMTQFHDCCATDYILISMGTHLKDSRIQYIGCGVLSSLARASSSNERMNDGASSGGIHSILNAMDAHAKDRSVQEWGIRALYAECESSDATKVNLVKVGEGESGTSGGIESIIERAMRTCFDPNVQEWGCRIINCISSCDSAASKLGPKAVRVLADAQTRFPKAVQMWEEACGAFANLSASGTLNDVKAIEKIIAVAIRKTQLKSEAMNIQTCRMLADLATKEENLAVILGKDVISAILHLLHNFPHSASLQEEALRFLCTISIGCKEGKAAVFSNCRIPSVIQAMQFHGRSRGVQEMAVRLLASLMADNSWVEESAKFIRAAAAIGGAMERYPQDRALQETCCTALRNMSSNEKMHDAMLQANCPVRITVSMDTHPASEAVQEGACAVVWNLSAGSGLRPSAPTARCVVRALRNHTDSGRTQEVACGALWSIATTEEVQRAVVAEGAVMAVDNALLIYHERDLRVVENACGALSALSACGVGPAGTIADAGLIGTMAALMRGRPESSAVFRSGCAILRNLAAVDENYAEEASGACSAIVTGMREHPADPGAQREACEALWSLAATSGTCRERILGSDGIAELHRTMGNLPGETGVQKAARAALEHLEGALT